jgi:hypothetical protein
VKKTSMNDNESPSATEDMLADLGVSSTEAAALRAILGEVAGMAHEVPEPSDEVRALLGGAIPLRSRRRMGAVAAVVGALALGGASAAAAANQLPGPVQEVVANATGGVVPHPVKPTNPPSDAPGHANKPTAPPTPKTVPTKTPKPANTTAPGQLQKQTKPDPTAPGPARPADPGSHGREHHESGLDGADVPKPEKPQHLDDDDGAGDSKPADGKRKKA